MAKSNILIRSKFKKAIAQAESGNLEEARSQLKTLYKTNRKNLEIGLNLALLHRKLGEFQQAQVICQNLLKDYPNNPDVHHMYGSALQCLGSMDESISEYKTAIKLNPNLTETHYFLGNIYRQTGQLEASADSFKMAIKQKPDFYEALNNLGAVLVELHRAVEAREALERAQIISPHSPQLLCNMAGFYMLDNNLEKAQQYAMQALKAFPDFIDALELLGKIHFQQSQYDDAINYYRKAYEISKNDELPGYIGQILERRGEFTEARDLIQPLVESGNTNFAVLMTYSALSRKFNYQEEAIAVIEKAIESKTMDISSLSSLHSELGKQYDSLKNYDKAFNNYKKANDIERTLNEEVKKLNETRLINNTRPEDIDKWFDNYPQAFWKQLPESGNTSERPIFVVGMFRSGTTLCEQILSSHPDVAAAGELPDISALSYGIGGGEFHDQSPASLIHTTSEQLSQAAEQYLNTLDTVSKESRMIVDKMPTNFFHVGLISKLFPNAHIIHMIRDPRDVCLSMYFQRFGTQMTFTTDLEELADYHLAYQRVMRYWKQVLDIEILDVVYEELVANQEEITRKTLDFCGLEWNGQCLNFHRSKRDVNTPSYDQVRKPLYSKSVARWKRYEKYLGPLLNKLGKNNSIDNNQINKAGCFLL